MEKKIFVFLLSLCLVGVIVGFAELILANISLNQ